jgi:putative redox protein
MTTPVDSKADSKPAAPVTARSQITWLGGRLFDAGPEGRTHRIDASATEAPGPVETLLSAIASCSSVDVIDIIAKRKTPVEKLSVNVAAERRAEFPRRVEKLHIEFHIDGAGIEHEHAERAIQLSYERYCSVAASLASDIVTETTLVLNGERFAPVKQQVWSPGSARPE